jgi:hypothetical protein
VNTLLVHPKQSGLGDSLRGLLTGEGGTASVQACAKQCHTMIVAALSNGHRPFLSRFLAVSPEDLALDLTEAVFHADEHGTFPMFTSAFSPAAASSATNDELVAQFRYSILNELDSVFCRRLRESDGRARRLVRNIHNAVIGSEEAEERMIHGDPWIFFHLGGNESPDAPLMPTEFLESALRELLRGKRTLPTVFAGIARTVMSQQLYRSSYPVYRLAAILRKVFFGHPPRLTEQFQRDILKSVAISETRLRRDYVVRKNVSPQLYPLYIRTVSDVILEAMFGNAPEKVSYFKAFSQHMPGIDRKEYLSFHRENIEHITLHARIELERYFKD